MSDWIRKRTARAALFGAVSLAPASACRRHASAEDCRAMSEHYIDIAIHESPNAARWSPAEAEAVREVERGLKRAEPAYRRVQDACEEIGSAEISCALGASTTKEWEACVHTCAPPNDCGR